MHDFLVLLVYTYKRNSIINTIGGVPVFTIAGSVEAYKKLAAHCYSNLTMESSVVLSEEAEKLHDLGFDWDAIESFEIQAIS